jgi:hypothetical protein
VETAGQYILAALAIFLLALTRELVALFRAFREAVRTSAKQVLKIQQQQQQMEKAEADAAALSLRTSTGSAAVIQQQIKPAFVLSFSHAVPHKRDASSTGVAEHQLSVICSHLGLDYLLSAAGDDIPSLLLPTGAVQLLSGALPGANILRAMV